MKKLSLLIIAAFLTISVIGQNRKNHSGFLNKFSDQKVLSVPGISDEFLNFDVYAKSAKQNVQLKEADALKQRLDSVVFAGSDKDVYMYDPNGNVLLDTYFDWDGTSWVNSWKDEYTYDSNGNQTQVISTEWDGNQWINLYKHENSYDTNGNQVKELSSNWDGNNWLNSHRNEFVYDAENNLTQNISSNWSGSPDDNWIVGGKNEFIYDSNRNQTQNILYYWNNDQWENASKTEYVFDANKNMTQAIEYGWDGENWNTSAKYETFFDANENITEFVFSEWNNDEWVKAAKYEYQYDANGNMTLSKLIYIDEGENFTYSKEESVYDDFGNRILYSFFEIDFENEELPLIPVWREEYAYDNNFSFNDLILPFNPDDFENDSEFDVQVVLQFDFTLMFKHKLVQLTYYEGDGDSWMMTDDYNIYYSEQNITGVGGLNLTNNVSVFPNPAVNQVTFKLDASVNQFAVEFYDIQGKLVMSKTTENNRPVSIESLNKGLYFYRLSENHNIYSGKLIVK